MVGQAAAHAIDEVDENGDADSDEADRTEQA
jgi:hypothetical protein